MDISEIKESRARLKLIFNPISGDNNESAAQFMGVIQELQSRDWVSEPYLIEPDCDLDAVIRRAMAEGIRLFVVCGGDGTIGTVAKSIMGTDSVLGIIPMGTQNNIALGLNVPTNISEAIDLLRTGERMKADAGKITCGGVTTGFIEVCTVGLLSTLFPSADDIQHGNITRLGDFFNSLTGTPQSDIKILLDGKPVIQEMGHVVLISNSPYVGRNYRVGYDDSFNDGMLDVSFFPDISKLDILGYMIKEPGTDISEDQKIQRFRARLIEIETSPVMAVMADGNPLGEGAVRIEVRPGAVNIIVGAPSSQVSSGSGETLEKK